MLFAPRPSNHASTPTNTNAASHTPRFGRVAVESNPLPPMRDVDPRPIVENVAAAANKANFKPASAQPAKASWGRWFSDILSSVSKAISTPVSAAAGKTTGAATFSWRVFSGFVLFSGFVQGIFDPQTWKTAGVRKRPVVGKHFPEFPLH